VFASVGTAGLGDRASDSASVAAAVSNVGD
jgi:hypothetical protein